MASRPDRVSPIAQILLQAGQLALQARRANAQIDAQKKQLAIREQESAQLMKTREDRLAVQTELDQLNLEKAQAQAESAKFAAQKAAAEAPFFGRNAELRNEILQNQAAMDEIQRQQAENPDSSTALALEAERQRHLASIAKNSKEMARLQVVDPVEFQRIVSNSVPGTSVARYKNMTGSALVQMQRDLAQSTELTVDPGPLLQKHGLDPNNQGQITQVTKEVDSILNGIQSRINEIVLENPKMQEAFDDDPDQFSVENITAGQQETLQSVPPAPTRVPSPLDDRPQQRAQDEVMRSIQTGPVPGAVDALEQLSAATSGDGNSPAKRMKDILGTLSRERQLAIQAELIKRRRPQQ